MPHNNYNVKMVSKLKIDIFNFELTFTCIKHE